MTKIDYDVIKYTGCTYVKCLVNMAHGADNASLRICF